jgi:uncharacterized protein YdaU (DUF1376 family)
MSNDARYMPLYVGAYLADTAHLSTVAHGAYLLLIMNYWQRGSALPSTDRKLASIARLTDVEWLSIRDDLAEFFIEENGLWRHGKIDVELRRAAQKIDAAKRAGEASASARAQAKSTTYQQPLDEPSTDAEQPSNHKVRIGKEDNTSSLRSDVTRARRASPPGFDEFWMQYPNKIGKGAALKAYTSARSRADQQTIMVGLAKYAAKADDRPWCNPATWLNQDRWLDDPAKHSPPKPFGRPNYVDAMNEILSEANNHERAQGQVNYSHAERLAVSIRRPETEADDVFGGS